MQERIKTLAAPPRILRRSRLFVDVQHGLCNRLRVLASAASIAKNTDRELVVIWVPDHHCEARISDLLAYDGPVIEDETAVLCRHRSAVVYNYMEIEEGSCSQVPIILSPYAGQDVYIRSADTLNSPHRSFLDEQVFLRNLRPAELVRSIAATARYPNQVAAHIRMGSGPGFEHLSYEASGNWPEHRHKEITTWREKSHVSRFAKRLDQLVTEDRAETIFVAADVPETYEILAERYGDRLTWIARDLYGREAAQIQYALADLLLLTVADLFLASTWSSFSDVAQRLASEGRQMERSGYEF